MERDGRSRLRGDERIALGQSVETGHQGEEGGDVGLSLRVHNHRALSRPLPFRWYFGSESYLHETYQRGLAFPLI
jgi:hypothetical protein